MIAIVKNMKSIRPSSYSKPPNKYANAQSTHPESCTTTKSAIVIDICTPQRALTKQPLAIHQANASA